MKTTDRDIRDALAARAARPAPRPADEFWPDFRARARLTPQDLPDAGPARPAIVWAAPLACAALLLVAVGLHIFSTPPPPAGEAIKSYEVVASHTAVIIMQDEETECTVMWVADMEPDTPDRDNT